METRSRTTKLIVKNVEMLESSKFDKFDKVSQWLDKLDTFEYHQHQKNPHIGAAANQQNTSSRMSQDKNDDFFDSDSSVNTGMTQLIRGRRFFGDIFIFPSSYFCFQLGTFWRIGRINENLQRSAGRRSRSSGRTTCNSSTIWMSSRVPAISWSGWKLIPLPMLNIVRCQCRKYRMQTK